MSAPIHAVVDLDGVGYDFVESVAARVRRRTGRQDLIPATCWNFPVEDWGLEIADFLDHVREGVLEGEIFAKGEPLPGTREGFELLSRLDDVVIHIITDRSPAGAEEAARRNTLAWLDGHGFAYDLIDVTADKVAAVRERAQPGAAIWTIDDKDSNWQAYRDAGFYSVLCRRPWNDHVAGQSILSVSSLWDFARILAPASGITQSQPALAAV